MKTKILLMEFSKGNMRDNSVSIAKAFAILLMVAGHANFSHIGNEIICLFHMPIFFFFSGYCLKSKYLSDFNLFAKKRIQRIWMPYIKWGGIFANA